MIPLLHNPAEFSPSGNASHIPPPLHSILSNPMLRDPSLYSNQRTEQPIRLDRRPATLNEEYDLLRPSGTPSRKAVGVFEYEATVAMLLRAGQAHYSPVLKQLYYWNDMGGHTLRVLRSAYTGAGHQFSPDQVVMDQHGYFRCTYRVALPDQGYAPVAAALRLAGIQLLLSYPA